MWEKAACATLILVAAACGDSSGVRDEVENETICCATQDGCYHGIRNTADCDLLFGTTGEPGTVCDAATATCQSPPSGLGRCCEVGESGSSVCLAGPSLDLQQCVEAGGRGFPDGAFCRPDGVCSVIQP